LSAVSLPPALVAHNLAARRGQTLLWRELAFALPFGHALIVRGPNGAGKSTLLRLIAALSAPAEGSLRWRDEPLTPFAPKLRADVVYIGHAAALCDELTAAENLAALATLAGDEASPAAIEQAFAALSITVRAAVSARALSAGQRRRVHLARLALTRRLLWVLDEPTTSLDDQAVAWLCATLEAHLARGGVAVIATHTPLALPPGRGMELAL
jgi:heme exporter protein A